MEKRVWDANICTSPNCKIKFNGVALPKQNFEAYAKMHEGIDNVCSMTSDRWSVCIGPSEDGMQQVSFVNGICTTKGGTHVDHVATLVASDASSRTWQRRSNSNLNRLRIPSQSLSKQLWRILLSRVR